jgi:hypothetical protein
MMAKADKDTTIAGTRLEAPCCGASGCFSPCGSLSGVSATCVPYVSAQSQEFSSPPISKTKKSRRMDDPATTFARLLTQIGLNHGLIWLMISYSQPSREGGDYGDSAPNLTRRVLVEHDAGRVGS